MFLKFYYIIVVQKKFHMKTNLNHCCKIDTLQVRELLTEGRGETIFEVGVPLSGDPSCEDYSIGLKQGNIIFNLC